MKENNLDSYNQQAIINNKKEEKKANFLNLRTLFLINLKKTIKDKSVYITGIVFLVISLIFAFFGNMFGSSKFAALLISQLNYIFCVFMFSILAILITVSVIKKQMLDGIHQIEQRAGITAWSSMLIRFLIQIIILWTFATFNLIIIFAFGDFADKDTFLAYVLSPALFFFFYSIFFSGITIIISVLFSISGGITINVIISMIIVLSGVFSGLTVTITAMETQWFGADVAKLNAQIKLGNDFYQEFNGNANLYGKETLTTIQKDPKSQPFEELIMDKSTDSSHQWTNYIYSEGVKKDSYCSYGLCNPWGNSYSNLPSTYIENYAVRVFKFGQFAIPSIDTEGQKGGYLLDELWIANEIRSLYEQVEKADSQNDKLLKVVQPSAYSKLFVEYIGKDININPMINFLISKNKDNKEVQELLKWTQKTYNNYKVGFSNNFNNNIFFGKLNSKLYKDNIEKLYDKPGEGGNTTIDQWSPRFTEDNQDIQISKEVKDEYRRAMEIYYKYPELMVISTIMFNGYLNSLYTFAQPVPLLGNSSSFIDKVEYWTESYEKYLSFNSFNLNWNLFNHLTIMYSGIHNNKVSRDLMMQGSVLGYAGNSYWYTPETIKQLQDYFLTAGDEGQDIKQLPYANVKVKEKSGFQFWALYLMYIVFAFVLIYLASLVFKWKAKI